MRSDSPTSSPSARVWGRLATLMRGGRSEPDAGDRDLERAQLRAYAEDLRNSYARELRKEAGTQFDPECDDLTVPTSR